MKFLVVDDSATMRRIVINSLQRIGYTDVVEATDGRDALGKVQSVDIVITDWTMPNMDGIEFVRALRARAEGAHIPVVMLTARGNRDDILRAVEAGVNGYVVRPFTLQTLKEKIDHVLERA